MINLKQLQQTSNQELNGLLHDFNVNATNILSRLNCSISMAIMHDGTMVSELMKSEKDLYIIYAKSFVANFRALDKEFTNINGFKIYDLLSEFKDLFLSFPIDKASSQSDVDWQNFLKLLKAIEFVFDDKIIDATVFTQLEKLNKKSNMEIAKHDFMLQQIADSDASSLVFVIGSGQNYKQIAPVFALESSLEEKTLVCNIDSDIYNPTLGEFYAKKEQWQSKTDIFEQVNARISDNSNISVILNNSNMNSDAMEKYSMALMQKKAKHKNFKVVFMYCESPFIPKYLMDAASALIKKSGFIIGKDLAFVNAYWLDSPCTVLGNMTLETRNNNPQLYKACGNDSTLSSITQTMEQCKKTASICQQDKSITMIEDLDNLNLDNILPNRFAITKQQITQGSAVSASSSISSKPPLKFSHGMSSASASSNSSSISSMSEEEQLEEAIQRSLNFKPN